MHYSSTLRVLWPLGWGRTDLDIIPRSSESLWNGIWGVAPCHGAGHVTGWGEAPAVSLALRSNGDHFISVSLSLKRISQLVLKRGNLICSWNLQWFPMCHCVVQTQSMHFCYWFCIGSQTETPVNANQKKPVIGILVSIKQTSEQKQWSRIGSDIT